PGCRTEAPSDIDEHRAGHHQRPTPELLVHGVRHRGQQRERGIRVGPEGRLERRLIETADLG
ncbi:MAG: hypothetical protein VW964_02455, partial [Ilumatobacter sp.]